MVKATTNADPSYRGVKTPPSNPYLSPYPPLFIPLGDCSKIFYSSYQLYNTNHTPWVLREIDISFSVEIRANREHPEPPYISKSKPMCSHSNFKLLSFLPAMIWHSGLSFLCTSQTPSQQRAFAPTVLSALNALPSDLHMLAPPWYAGICFNISSREVFSNQSI